MADDPQKHFVYEDDMDIILLNLLEDILAFSTKKTIVKNYH